MKHKILFIIGMHRSGTSFVSNYIGSLKSHYHDDELIEDRANENQDGFFESKGFNLINRKILNFNNQSWHQIYPTELIYPKHIKKEAQNFLKSKLIDNKALVLKDPRTTILFDFWLKIINDLKLTYKIVMVFRHPEQVSKSLKIRSETPYSFSKLIWFHYNYFFLNNLDVEKILINFNSIESTVTRLLEYLDDTETQESGRIINSLNKEKLENLPLINKDTGKIYNLYQFMLKHNGNLLNKRFSLNHPYSDIQRYFNLNIDQGNIKIRKNYLKKYFSFLAKIFN